MYTVYVRNNDGIDNLLYSPNMVNDNYIIYEATISKELNSVDSFEFTIPRSNPMYEKILLYSSTIKVLNGDTNIFFGRPISYEIDFYGNVKFTCEGALGFLNDEVDSGAKYEIGTTVRSIIHELLDSYNPQREKYDYMARSIYFAALADTDVQTMAIHNEVYENADTITYLELLQDVIEQVGGLYIFTTSSGNKSYLHLIDKGTPEIIDTITFGENLQDISISSNADDAFSVILPIGDYMYYADPIEGKKQGSSRYKLSFPGYDGTPSSYTSNVIEDGNLISKIGYIVREVVFEDGPSNDTDKYLKPWDTLHNMAVLYMRNVAYENTTITIKAIKLDPSKVVNLGDSIRIIDPYNNVVEGDYMVTSMDIDLMDPASTTYDLNGMKATTLSNTVGTHVRHINSLYGLAYDRYRRKSNY